MKRKNEKGFALVLSLVLLLVMSLMGGALIVISSGDHQSNNSSDESQQAFYVAETGLLEAEKNIINQYMGPWTSITKVPGPGEGATEDEIESGEADVTTYTDGDELDDEDGGAPDFKEDDGYKAFFQKALKKWGASSPDDIPEDDKKEFYDYVDRNWKADKETD